MTTPQRGKTSSCCTWNCEGTPTTTVTAYPAGSGRRRDDRAEPAALALRRVRVHRRGTRHPGAGNLAARGRLGRHADHTSDGIAVVGGGPRREAATAAGKGRDLDAIRAIDPDPGRRESVLLASALRQVTEEAARGRPRWWWATALPVRPPCSGWPGEALDPSAGVIAGLLGDQGRQDGGSGQPRGLRFDCSSRPRNCAFHASPRRCSRESPTYVAALRSIAVRSASDRSRRTLPGTPATSTPSGTCCPSASTVPAAMIE